MYSGREVGGIMNKREKLEAKIQNLAEIGDIFKNLGKFLYICWKDKKKHNFNLIMDEFDKDLTKLKEIKI